MLDLEKICRSLVAYARYCGNVPDIKEYETEIWQLLSNKKDPWLYAGGVRTFVPVYDVNYVFHDLPSDALLNCLKIMHVTRVSLERVKIEDIPGDVEDLMSRFDGDILTKTAIAINEFAKCRSQALLETAAELMTYLPGYADWGVLVPINVQTVSYWLTGNSWLSSDQCSAICIKAIGTSIKNKGLSAVVKEIVDCCTGLPLGCSSPENRYAAFSDKWILCHLPGVDINADPNKLYSDFADSTPPAVILPYSGPYVPTNIFDLLVLTATFPKTWIGTLARALCNGCRACLWNKEFTLEDAYSALKSAKTLTEVGAVVEDIFTLSTGACGLPMEG